MFSLMTDHFHGRTIVFKDGHAPTAMLLLGGGVVGALGKPD